MSAGDDDPALEQTTAQSGAPTAELATLDAGAGPTIAAAAAGLPEVAAARYQMGDEVGRGGLGRVLRARDRVLQRAVAIKELLGVDDATRRRFVREAMITARLQHPSIVPVYEAGRWRDGAPFYAMKLVAGRPLSDAIADAVTLEARLGLVPTVVAVADAIAYAHSERIVHRDLKPGNVLLGSFGETVVIDWGLAKDLAIDDRDALDAGPYRDAPSDQTAAGAILGTPAYMAPEQAIGEEVDERADVYAIGAMLYHVVAGAIPHEGKSLDDVIRRVLAGEITPLAIREPRAPADLATIVAKAMARDPARRYPTAKQLAEDLRRFQTGQLVGSHRYTLIERIRRWVRRHRAIAAVTAAAAIILVVYGTWSIRRILAESSRADRERDEARAQRDEAIANGNRAILAQAQASLDRDPTETLRWLAQLDRSGPGWAAARVVLADALARPRRIGGVPGIHMNAVVRRDGRYAALQRSSNDVVVLEIATDRVLDFDLNDGSYPTFCTDGRHLVLRGFDDAARATTATLDLETLGREIVVADEPAHLAARARCNGGFVVIAGRLQRWDSSRAAMVTIGEVAAADGDVTTKDGVHAFVEEESGAMTWWDASGRRGRVEAPGGGYPPERSSDGRVVAYRSGKNVVVAQFDRALQITIPDLDPPTLALSPDGGMIALGANNGTVSVYDCDDGELIVTLRGAPALLNLGWSADATWLIAAGAELVAWHLPSTREPIRLGASTASAIVDVTADDRVLVYGMADRTLTVWSLVDPLRTIALQPLDAAVLSSDGRWLVTLSGRTAVRRDLVAGTIETATDGWDVDELPALIDVTTSGDAVLRSYLRLYRWRSGADLVALPEVGEVDDRAGITGDSVLAVAVEGLVRVTGDRVERMPISSPDPFAPPVPLSLVLSPDRRLAAVDAGAGLQLFDVETSSHTPIPGVWPIAFSAGGAFLAAGDGGREIVVLDRTGAERRRYSHTLPLEYVDAVAITDDGRTLAVGGGNVVDLVDLVDGTSRRVVEGTAVIESLRFDHRGASLAATWVAQEGYEGADGHSYLGTSRIDLVDPSSGAHRSMRARTLAVAWRTGTLVFATGAGVFELSDDLPRDAAGLAAVIAAAAPPGTAATIR